MFERGGFRALADVGKVCLRAISVRGKLPPIASRRQSEADVAQFPRSDDLRRLFQFDLIGVVQPI